MKRKLKVCVIFAHGESDSLNILPIGKDGVMPWGEKPFCPEDAKHFSQYTQDSILVMGSKTWLSLPYKLPCRFHAVLTNREDLASLQHKDKNGHIVHPDIYYHMEIRRVLEEIIENGLGPYDYEKVCIIGGATIYKEVFETCADLIDEISITSIDKKFEYDAYLTHDSIATVFDKMGEPVDKTVDCDMIELTEDCALYTFSKVDSYEFADDYINNAIMNGIEDAR